MNNDIKHKKRLVEDLEAGNQRSYEELCEAAGGQVPIDTSDMRRELFYRFLVDWGIITEDQMLDFELAFHRKVEEALTNYWQQFREHQKKVQRANLTVVKNPTGLVDGNGRPLGG